MRRRRLLWPLVGSVVLVGILFLAVFPTRTWLGQRRALQAAEARVEVLDEQNRRLAARVAELKTDEEIERLAREQYQLVKPGEEAYAILPAPAPPDDPQPADAAADGDDERAGPWWERLWRTVTDRF